MFTNKEQCKFVCIKKYNLEINYKFGLQAHVPIQKINKFKKKNPNISICIPF